MTQELISVQRDAQGVATVTLNNPDKHNAFDDQMIAQLTQAFAQIAGDSSVRAMILASTGKSFSAGADLNWMKRMAGYSYNENLEDARALARMLRTLNFMPQPTIAKVQGAAYGGAVGLVSCCDIALGSSDAQFSLSEVKIGLIPATISPYVIAAIGARASRRYFLTAERFSADIAAQLGLLSEVCVPEKLDESIDHFTNQLLENSPAAIQDAKTLIFDVGASGVSNNHSSDAKIEETCKRIAAIRVSDEGREGLSAFLEKRRPSWRAE